MLARAFLVACLVSGLRAAVPSGSVLWIKALRELFEDCPRARLLQCVESRALGAVDDILTLDVVPFLDGLEFVKVKSKGRDVQQEWDRNYQVDERNGTFSSLLGSRLMRLLKTHAIKIDVDQLPDILDFSTARFFSSSSSGQMEARGKGRRRRRHHMNLMPIMMMGVLLMGTVLIPMSFQFLAVLGGKALILSKMALMLSSIQGLKKIATNGMNYGLYHTPVPEPWNERSTSPYEIPYAPSFYGHFAGRSAVKS